MGSVQERFIAQIFWREREEPKLNRVLICNLGRFLDRFCLAGLPGLIRKFLCVCVCVIPWKWNGCEHRALTCWGSAALGDGSSGAGVILVQSWCRHL